MKGVNEEMGEREGDKGMTRDGKGGWGERGMKEEERIYKIAFWNVAGLRNKNVEFWKGLKKWDIMVLSETWMDQKGWEKIRGIMPKGHKWEIQLAGKKSRKRRAIGGMVLGVREEIKMEEGSRERGRIDCQ